MMKRLLALASLGLCASQAMAAEACLDNFVAEGNFLTGKTYKTWAVIEDVKQADAFTRAYAYTVGNGFTVTTSNQEAGAISAAQSVSYGKGATVPLGIVVQAEGSATRVSMNYATSGGLVSPESAIKKHFCGTIAAAANGSATAAPAAAAGGRGFATATAAQQDGYIQEIARNVGSEKLRPAVTQATPAIAAFLGQLACLNHPGGASALNAHAAPGVNLHNRYVGLSPMRSARYHDKSSCMSVSRVHGWKAPANNALQFEVVYKAEDSGEISKLKHEVIRQPDGSWMFSM